MMDYAGRVAQADTYPKLLRLNAKEHGGEIALREKDFGLWRVFTWNDYQTRVHDFALGMIELGLGRGDVIGIMDRGTLRIGDTLGGDGTMEFQGIPRFPPEHFARVIPADALRRKQFDSGLRQLTEEGAAQVRRVDLLQVRIGVGVLAGRVQVIERDPELAAVLRECLHLFLGNLV